MANCCAGHCHVRSSRWRELLAYDLSMLKDQIEKWRRLVASLAQELYAEGPLEPEWKVLRRALGEPSHDRSPRRRRREVEEEHGSSSDSDGEEQPLLIDELSDEHQEEGAEAVGEPLSGEVSVDIEDLVLQEAAVGDELLEESEREEAGRC